MSTMADVLRKAMVKGVGGGPCVCGNADMCTALLELMTCHWQGAASTGQRQDEVLEALAGAITLLDVTLVDGKAVFEMGTIKARTNVPLEDEEDSESWPRLRVCAHCYRRMVEAPLQPRPDLVVVTTFETPRQSWLRRAALFTARLVHSICARSAA